MNALADLHCAMGERLRRMGLYEQAADNFRRSLEHLPTLTAAHIGLGVCLRFTGAFEEAEHAFERALSLETENVDAHFELGNALRARGRLQSAQKAYRAALELEPYHAEARYFLSVVTPGDTPTSIPVSLVKDLFDAYAPAYDDHVVRRHRYDGPRVLRQAVEPREEVRIPDQVVVDLGCGTGLCGPIFRDIAKRLIGVDISPRMLDSARELGVYDELRVEDLQTTVRTAGRVFDLALAADVLVYFGDLAELFVACSSALRDGGRFAFTAESTDPETSFVLMPGGRFAHGRRYIESVAAKAGFNVERYSTAILRFENGQPIQSHVFVVRRGPVI